ncbi:MAG: hypothetical protein EOP33_07670 [Rickettsiaceae bacterium]|nr:MAG: hypothetical protein EOP33_07670 [Rickettsiaceae bacterium]
MDSFFKILILASLASCAIIFIIKLINIIRNSKLTHILIIIAGILIMSVLSFGAYKTLEKTPHNWSRLSVTERVNTRVTALMQTDDIELAYASMIIIIMLAIPVILFAFLPLYCCNWYNNDADSIFDWLAFWVDNNNTRNKC